MIKLIVVSDVRLYREGLSKILNEVSSIAVVGDANNVNHALDLIGNNQTDIVLLDMRMVDSYKLIDVIKNQSLKPKLIVLSMAEDEADVISCAEAGIFGYLPRGSSLKELVESIMQVSNGEIYCPSCIAKYLLNNVKNYRNRINVFNEKSPDPVMTGVLTRRERQIVNMIADGYSNKQIASNLTIEVSTVKNHVHSVLVKLDAKSRTQVIAMLQHTLSI